MRIKNRQEWAETVMNGGRFVGRLGSQRFVALEEERETRIKEEKGE
jgi:hypothetical protein